MSKYRGKILVVDDDKDVLYTAKLILKSRFNEITTAERPDVALKLFKSNPADVILLDMNFATGATSGNEGLFWLKEFLKEDPKAHIVLNTAYGDINVAVEGMKEGAVDFIVKPWEKEKLLATVSNIYELKKSKKNVGKLENQKKALTEEIGNMVGQPVYVSSQMKRLMESIDKVAPTDANVLIMGENGVGKEVIARTIHDKSHRAHGPFIKVDLGSLTESLFESEIFGHVKGAYTDAREDRVGRFEIADGGTLFLDEIGNISGVMQTKLLTALQTRIVTRVGSNKEISVNVRIISATNRSLPDLTSSDHFRQDLLYRINTVEMLIPPLRERNDDIVFLAIHFLRKFSGKYNKSIIDLSEKAIEAIQSYPWPGNIRELEHAVERAVIMTDKNVLEPSDLITRTYSEDIDIGIDTLKVDLVEKKLIRKALMKCNENLTKTANELGMGRSTLYRKMKKYGLM